jgi:hypothetical protein
MYKEESRNLLSSPNIIQEIKSMIILWAVHMEQPGDDKNAYMVLVENLECEVPLGRLRCR